MKWCDCRESAASNTDNAGGDMSDSTEIVVTRERDRRSLLQVRRVGRRVSLSIAGEFELQLSRPMALILWARLHQFLESVEAER